MNPATQASGPIAPSPKPASASGARAWFRWGFAGGPAGQIALMHRLVVDEALGRKMAPHALNYCMLLPGLSAAARHLSRLAAPDGRDSSPVRPPGAIVMFGLSLAYVWSRQFELSAGVFLGLKAAVLAIVVDAVIRIGRRSLKNRLMIGIAVAAFLAIFIFQVPFPLIILGAGVIGAIGATCRPDLFSRRPCGGRDRLA
jgi:chromate transporter